MEEKFNKFAGKNCTLTKLKKNLDSVAEEGHTVTGPFFPRIDSLGIRAAILHSCGTKQFRTSDIKNIVEETDNSITFETQTSVYKLEEINGK